MSDQEVTQKIIKYVIKNTPYGEIQPTLLDLNKLIPDFSSQQNDFALQLLKQHNEEHLALVLDDKDQRGFVVTATGYEEDYYVDQRTNTKIYIDQQKLVIIKAEPYQINIDSNIRQFRDELENQLYEYAYEFFSNVEKCRLGVYVHASGKSIDDMNIYIALTCKNSNFKNFSGGEWISEWNLSNSSLKGKIRINTHYYEEGNVQLTNIKDVNEQLTIDGNNLDDARQIVEIIQKYEDQVHSNLQSLYENMTLEVFTALRRTIPVTRTKMDWSNSVLKVRSSLKNQ